jgi:hypothetical protein
MTKNGRIKTAMVNSRIKIFNLVLLRWVITAPPPENIVCNSPLKTRVRHRARVNYPAVHSRDKTFLGGAAIYGYLMSETTGGGANRLVPGKVISYFKMPII